MNNIFCALLFLLFELNVTLYDGGLSYCIWLIPRFLGYFILLKECEAVQENRWYEKNRPLFFILGCMEFMRYLINHTITYRLGNMYISITSALSLCATIFVVYILTQVVREFQSKYEVAIGAEKLRVLWILMTIINIASIFVSANLFGWICKLFVSTVYCVCFLRSKRMLLEQVPGNEIEKFNR